MIRSTIKTQVLIVLFFSFIISNLFSQTFTEMTSVPLTGVSGGSVAWGDYDNDGFLDILISGSGITKVYKNNGNSTFTEQAGITAVLTGVYNASAAWGDYDNDGDLDILLTGSSNGGPSGAITKIYRNNGTNTFTEIIGNSLTGVMFGSAAWSDYDSDGDLDFVIMGLSSSNVNVTKIYKKNGTDKFEEQTSVQLPGIQNGSIAWGDYDNDGLPDLIQTGYSVWQRTKLYHNNGDNTFTLSPSFQNDGYYGGTSIWNDYNNDGRLDVFLCGSNGNPASFIYQNNTNSTFTKQTGLSITAVSLSSAAWGDCNNDGYADLLVSGTTNGTAAGGVSKLFKNNGNNTFTEISAGLSGLIYTSVAWGDYDNDGDLDILLSGSNGTLSFTKIYRNDITTANTSAEAPAILSPQVTGSEVMLSWKTVRNDVTFYKAITYNVMVGTSSGSGNILSPQALASSGFRRLPAMGNGQLDTTLLLKSLKPGSYFWKVQAVDNGYNGGAFSPEGTFSISTYSQAFNVAPTVTGSFTTSIQWSRGTGTGCSVFIKEADTGTAAPVDGFSYIANTSFGLGSQIGSSGWYCVYNGTMESVTVTNLKYNTSYIVHVCELTGPTTYLSSTSTNNPATFTTDCFTEQAQSSFTGGASGNVMWGDYNNDGFLDFISPGPSNNALIYKNNGNNTFTAQTAITLSGIVSGMACWGDYNNDGYLDLLQTGSVSTKLYKNNGNNTFNEQTSIVLDEIHFGAVAWADFDNDGDLEIILSGENGGQKISKIFRNNGDGTFNEQPGISLPGIVAGAVAIADYNKDGFMDICIGGELPTGYATQIFVNNGDFTFTYQPQISLNGIYSGDASWGDYNSDGYIDLFLTGIYSGSSLYKNNGNNSFSIVPTPAISSVSSSSSVTWGDFDNDGDLDLFLSGYSYSDDGYITRTYRNDGSGTFTEMKNIRILGGGNGSISLGDYDNDGDLDVLITGTSNESVYFVKMYKNDISSPNVIPEAPGDLAEIIDRKGVTLKWKSVTTDATPGEAITYNIRVGKTAGNGEIIASNSATNGFRRIGGYGNMQNDTSFMLKNLSPGTYYWSIQSIDNNFAGSSFATERQFIVPELQSQNLSASIFDSKTLFLKWERGNGERCAVFCKQGVAVNASPVNNTTYLADNVLGYGNQIGTSGWFCIYNGRADSILLKGLAPNNSYSIHVIEYTGGAGSENYYTSSSTSNPGVFETTLLSEQTSMPFTKNVFGSAAFADYNNDNYLDLIITGTTGSSGVTQLYKNNGNNTFTDQTLIPITGLIHSAMDWGDYDNDGYVDLLITGGTSYNSPYNPVTKLYHNNEGTGFTEQTAVSITGVSFPSVEWGDYNNDGFIDFVIAGATGTSTSYNPITEIYKNNGTGTFTPLSVSLPGIYQGTVNWGDYDNDGDLDLLIIGTNASWAFISKLFQNNGSDSFTEVTSFSISGSAPVSAAWGDYNNDGYLDLIMAGGSIEVYKNNGDKTFSKQAGILIPGVNDAKIEWADFNNDRRLDFIWTGRYGVTYKAAVFLNNGNNSFSEYPNVLLTGSFESALTCGDYDNDGDIDFFLAGFSSGGYFTSMYRNNIIMNAGNPLPNSKPVAPAGLTNQSVPGGVVLKWNPVKLNESNYKTLTYNVKVINTDNSDTTVSPHSLASGIRTVVRMGNCQMDTSLLLMIPQGNYKWSVQAVDQIYAGGTWSDEQAFSVKNTQAFFKTDTVCLGLFTSFTDQSVATDGIASWKWDFKDGTISTLQNPSHKYTSGGSFNVRLVVTSNITGTKDSIDQIVVVKLKPVAGFTAPTVCIGTSSSITNITDEKDLIISSWLWKFGDGLASAARDPLTHLYTLANTYVASLKVTATNGCADSISQNVIVAPLPVASISVLGNTSFCQGDSVKLSVPIQSNTMYQWKISSNNILNATSNVYTVKNSGGSYTALVSSTQTAGCEVTSAPTAITVWPVPANPYILTTGSTTFCQGDSVLLSISSVNDATYQWKLNGGDVGSNSNQFVAKNSGTYNIVVSNSNGCSVNASNSIYVVVNSLPAVSAVSLSGPATFCTEGNITLSIPLNSAYSYNWRNEDGLITGASTNSYLASTSGIYQLDITNSSGCIIRTTPVNVVVNPMPYKPVITSDNYQAGKCLGETPIRLNVDQPVSGYSYQWYKNGIPINSPTSSYIEGFLSQGDYAVEADLNGCKLLSDILNVTFDDAPEKPYIYAQGPTVWYLACSNDSATRYKWYYNGTIIPGADQYLYVANQKLGKYVVSISNSKGCFTASDTIKIPTGATGIEEVDPFTGLKIYPNPTTGMFTIEMDNQIFGELMIKIITHEGKQILNIKFEKTTEHFSSQVDLNGQGKGIYLINLSIDKYRSNRKLVID